MKESTILASCMSNNQVLAGLAVYADDAIVSKTLIDKSVGTVTLFAFDVGQSLSTHSAPYDALVQVIEGSAEVVIADELLDVAGGEVVIMPANVPHSVRAKTRFKMLLTMIREK